MILIQIILGAIQGIFEWLPISSEGVLTLTASFLSKEFNPIDIALFLHLGTLFSCIIYFRKDWKKVILFKDRYMFRFLAIATLISLVIGFPVYKFIKHIALGNWLLFLTGIGLLFTAYFHKSKKIKQIRQKTLSYLVGFLQGFSVVPGFSRSGATIFGLSLGNLKPHKVLKMSYMLSVPVGVIANAYLFLKNPGLISQAWIGLITSFIVGMIGLHFLVKIAEKINFFKFALIFAILCFFGAIFGFIL